MSLRLDFLVNMHITVRANIKHSDTALWSSAPNSDA